jgi:hypothetical protein
MIGYAADAASGCDELTGFADGKAAEFSAVSGPI